MAAARNIDPTVWFRHAWRNRIQSLLLLTVMAGFLALLGWLLWGRDGLFILVSVGIGVVLASPVFSPWLVMRMYGATPLSRNEAPVLWQAVSELSARAGLVSHPELFYVPSRMLNAFAVGTRDKSAIAVTSGLLRQLDMDELVGVLAHEISHIRSNDLWVMGLADLFSRGTSLLSLFGQVLLLLNLPLILLAETTINWWAILLLIFAPNLSALAQLALSRTREYDADLNAVRLAGNAQGLARALARIERTQGGWLEHILLPGRRVPQPSLLRTHPLTEERIARLKSLSKEWTRTTLPALEFQDTVPTYARARRPDSRVPRWHINGLWF